MEGNWFMARERFVLTGFNGGPFKYYFQASLARLFVLMTGGLLMGPFITCVQI
jgi:hypothetical protein